MYTRLRGGALLFSIMATFSAMGGGEARGQATEMERLQQCDRDLCTMLRMPAGDGGPLQCDLSKTWYKEEIEKVAKPKGLTWVLGDAHCTLKLDISRSTITRAITEETYHLKVPEQPASCEVEYKGSRYPVKATVAPEMDFRSGRATSVLIGIRDIEANLVVKTLVWSAAKLQEKMGFYQDDLVKGVNHYIEKECGARPGERQAESSGPAAE